MKKRTFLEDKKNELLREFKELQLDFEQTVHARDTYTMAVDALYAKSIGDLKNRLDMAIGYVIRDKNYAVKLDIEDKRGTKNLVLSLIDNDLDMEVDLMSGVGQGVRTVISFVLKTYYLLNKGSRILFLDEKYSALSANYIDRFFEFVKELCKKEHMIIVMITHDERIMCYADYGYLVNDGVVTKAEI